MITPHDALGDIVAAHPSSTDILLRHRLDFCCGGRASLQVACDALELDAVVVAKELNDALTTASDDVNWREADTGALLDHIVQNFHEKHRVDLPSLVAAAEKVERVHAKKAACPKGLAEHLRMMHGELEQHMRKEEHVLFPLLRQRTGMAFDAPISVMMQEHDAHGEELARLRELTDDLVAPAEACATWRALYDGLERLERELMTHIHLENNVLFPRALGHADGRTNPTPNA